MLAGAVCLTCKCTVCGTLQDGEACEHPVLAMPGSLDMEGAQVALLILERCICVTRWPTYSVQDGM